MNRLREYAKNNTGISISSGYGQINIAKLCMKVLGNPRKITFAKLEPNSDWMHLIPDCKNPPEGSVTGTVQYRNRAKKSSAYIASQEIVQTIFATFNLRRRNPFVYAPFYIVQQDNYDDKPCVKVCMDFFKNHMHENNVELDDHLL